MDQTPHCLIPTNWPSYKLLHRVVSHPWPSSLLCGTVPPLTKLIIVCVQPLTKLITVWCLALDQAHYCVVSNPWPNSLLCGVSALYQAHCWVISRPKETCNWVVAFPRAKLNTVCASLLCCIQPVKQFYYCVVFQQCIKLHAVTVWFRLISVWLCGVPPVEQGSSHVVSQEQIKLV